MRDRSVVERALEGGWKNRRSSSDNEVKGQAIRFLCRH